MTLHLPLNKCLKLIFVSFDSSMTQKCKNNHQKYIFEPSQVLAAQDSSIAHSQNFDQVPHYSNKSRWSESFFSIYVKGTSTFHKSYPTTVMHKSNFLHDPSLSKQIITYSKYLKVLIAAALCCLHLTPCLRNHM